jgi:hypothetical protein
LVYFSTDLTARQVTDQALSAAGITRNVRVTCNEIGSLLGFVAHGLGIAIVPRPLAIASPCPYRVNPARKRITGMDRRRRDAASRSHQPRSTSQLGLIPDTAKPVQRHWRGAGGVRAETPRGPRLCVTGESVIDRERRWHPPTV